MKTKILRDDLTLRALARELGFEIELHEQDRRYKREIDYKTDAKCPHFALLFKRGKVIVWSTGHDWRAATLEGDGAKKSIRYGAPRPYKTLEEALRAEGSNGAESVPKFISIPAVGAVPAYIVDPLNKTHVRNLIARADAYFKLSAKAWEQSTDGRNQARAEKLNQRENDMAERGAALLKPLGIVCDWPGLYPCFTVNGFTEYATESAVLSALEHPGNWLSATRKSSKTR